MTRTLVLSCLVALGAWSCGDDGTAGPTRPVEDGEATELVFADSALTAVVAEALATTPADSLTSLTARERGIADLTGIDQLSRLRVLDLAHNEITEVAPLADLDGLTFLDLTANQIADVSPLAGLERLEFLLLAGNRITDIAPLLPLPRLLSLELTGNPLTAGQLEHTAALVERGVQVVFEGQVEPTPPLEEPDFGALTFAFRGYSQIGHRLNIWLGSTDGSPARPLIEENADFGIPVWSPDGTRLVFSSNREDPLRQFRKIYVADADGSGLEAISDWDAGSPVAWSPDGSRIAVVQRHGNISADLYVMNPDGTGLRQLTDPYEALDGAEGDLSWSPDSRRIAFKRRSGHVSADFGPLEQVHPDSAGLVIVDIATGEVDRLTAEGVGTVAWSPRTEQILFTAFVGDNEEILVIRADGTGLNNLTSHPASDTQPHWSPDGSQIVFVSSRDSPGETFGDVFAMNADGADVRKLTESDARYVWPSWSPDGRVIAYVSDRSGIWSIHVADPLGRFDLNVTAGDPEIEWYSGRVIWQPR